MFEDVEEDLLEFSPYPPNTTINDRLNKKCSCEVGTQVNLFSLLETFKLIDALRYVHWIPLVLLHLK